MVCCLWFFRNPAYLSGLCFHLPPLAVLRPFGIHIVTSFIGVISELFTIDSVLAQVKNCVTTLNLYYWFIDLMRQKFLALLLALLNCRDSRAFPQIFSHMPRP